MLHSIRTRLVIILAGMVAGTLMFCILLNSFFLEGYYKSNKEAALNSVYHQLQSIIRTDRNLLNPENQDILQEICEQSSVSLLVLNANQQTLFSTGNGDRELAATFFNMIVSGSINFSDNENQVEDIVDSGSGLRYLEMYGALNEESYFIMRVPMESIRQSVNISNRFFLYISYLAIALSVVIMWYISKSFTKPILQLADISEKMSELDFDVKYVGDRNDEIGVLGTSMNKLSGTLETTISELKAANNELQKDINQKIEIDNMRKEFLSNVSHELKTPIALIQGYAEGLKEGISEDPESMEFYCDVIIDEANKMNKMVKNLLELNQLEFGNGQITFERFDLISVISGVLSRSTILIEQKGATIIFDNRKSIYVWADEFQIEQVITNYITNALNHLDEKKTVRIDVAEQGENIRVAIFNSGSHIPEEDLDRIWIKFYKVDKARTREYGGNGIGLSIVKAVMDAHNQKCGVANVEGGVVFWFEVEKDKKQETRSDTGEQDEARTRARRKQ